ncbi:hypothetical protein C8F01DRAFT_1093595 [Mycena amicta]|nr:hypothetical protein C8F01DRAFT_1095321 [Mycena amicta]KAJ7049236.1 hypothetical protein C8F01DRAFT_1093595 [Mycena amicta]
MPPEHSAADKQYIGIFTDGVSGLGSLFYALHRGQRHDVHAYDWIHVNDLRCRSLGQWGSSRKQFRANSAICPCGARIVTPDCFDACSTLSTGGDEYDDLSRKIPVGPKTFDK